MSISYNKVILVGRLTRDPEIKSLPSGSQVAKFAIAVDRNYNDEVDFINIIAFGKQAEFVSNYLLKGKLVLVEGSLRINSFTDREGVNRQKAEVNAVKITFMETKKSQEQKPSVERTYHEKPERIAPGLDDYQQDDEKIDMIDEVPNFEDPFADLDDSEGDEAPI